MNTVHCTLFTVHSVLHTALSTVHCSLGTVHNMLHTAMSTVRSALSTVNCAVKSAVCSVRACNICRGCREGSIELDWQAARAAADIDFTNLTARAREPQCKSREILF